MTPNEKVGSTRDAVAGFGSGTASAHEIDKELQKIWAELTSDERKQAAALLEVGADAVSRTAPLPLRAESAAAGAGGLELAIVVVGWVGSEILLGALKELAKEEVKKRLRALLDKILLPKLEKKFNKDQLGSEVVIPD